MNFYSDAAKRILQLELNNKDTELSARLQDAHGWLMAQHKAWCDLEAQMREKACSVPKMLSEDRKREKILESIRFLEKGSLHAGVEIFNALIEANPKKPKLRGWYKRPDINSSADCDALTKARMRPTKIAIM